MIKNGVADAVVNYCMEDVIWPGLASSIQKKIISNAMSPHIPEYCSKIAFKTANQTLKQYNPQIQSRYPAQDSEQPTLCQMERSCKFRVRYNISSPDKTIQTIQQQTSRSKNKLKTNYSRKASKTSKFSVGSNKTFKVSHPKLSEISIQPVKHIQLKQPHDYTEPWEQEMRNKQLIKQREKTEKLKKAHNLNLIKTLQSMEMQEHKFSYDEEGNVIICKEPDIKKYPVMWWNVPSKMESSIIETNQSKINLNPQTFSSKVASQKSKNQPYKQKQSLISQYFKAAEGVSFTMYKNNSSQPLFQIQNKRTIRTFTPELLQKEDLHMTFQQYKELKLFNSNPSNIFNEKPVQTVNKIPSSKAVKQKSVSKTNKRKSKIHTTGVYQNALDMLKTEEKKASKEQSQLFNPPTKLLAPVDKKMTLVTEGGHFDHMHKQTIYKKLNRNQDPKRTRKQAL